MGSISRTPSGSRSGDELARVTRRALRLWHPPERRFVDVRWSGNARHRGWGDAIESIALVVDAATCRALSARRLVTLGELARAREGSRRTLAHRWCEAAIAMADTSGRTPCTGFLIAPDVLVTTRHGVREELNGARDLADLRFLFAACWSGDNAALDGSVYVVDCAGRPGDPVLGVGTDGWSDFAVLRVGPAAGSSRAGPGIPIADELEDGEWVTAIGHPFGLPMTTAGVEPIELGSDDRVAFAPLDVFSGNSGSPVLRVADQRVIGVVQSKPGWDFIAHGPSSIRLARDECAGGEPARLVRMHAILRALDRDRFEHRVARDHGRDTTERIG